MLEGPLGGAAFNNELVVPATGYFRTFEESINGVEVLLSQTYMLAGGLGNIRYGILKKVKLR